ncbi:hypothetical protein [Parapedobacter sp. 10938]|uniref:hypothetical protein n=1 Tax=Parapedobacter flavus TaxID=3110225 RepID=UPI002DBB0B63|nr:hypothetical protein [Parapedobacter sp. 10938]MEC3879732.1 hypothetical protein [Parapedobacter sp. 10938]
MMMKTEIYTKYRYVWLTISILTAMALGFGLGKTKNNFIENENENTPPPASVNDNRTFFWEIYPELVIPSTGREIDGNISLVDSNLNVTPLIGVLKDFPILVLRYSKFDCHVCVNQVLDKLVKRFEGNEEKVCLLVDGYSARELRLKYRGKSLKFPIYILEDEKLGLSLENKNLPFLFVFKDFDLDVDKIFVPFKEHSEQTDTYLEHVFQYMDMDQ